MTKSYFPRAKGQMEIPRLTYLHVKNYRALRDLELNDIQPLTALLGPNGSGKSTVFNVFAFLSECFTTGLRKAWDNRGRFKELRTRGAEGPIEIELKYKEAKKFPLITYHLSIEEKKSGPVVLSEWLKWKRGPHQGAPFKFLNFEEGRGIVISGEMPEEKDRRIQESLDSEEMLAVNTLGQLARHPRVSALRRFITGWYLSYLTADNARVQPEAGPQERLSQRGDNLANVIQYLKEQHPERLEKILKVLTRRIPRLERVDAEIMQDGRLLLQLKDAPFERPIMAKFASDGTLKMLSYLTLLHDPQPPPLIGIEEPENYLHPRLLPELVEECRDSSARSQLMITTHSPYFVNSLRAEELWILYRDDKGHTRAKKAADMAGVMEHINQGASLGDLWMEGFFEFGDPLRNQGGPTH